MNSGADTNIPGLRRPFLLGLILSLAFVLRAYRLGSLDYWFDEAIALFSADNLPFCIAFEMAPPLYFLLLHGWLHLFGGGETAVRFLSLLFSCGSVAVLYALSRRLFGERPALWAAFFLTVSPLAVYYAQEVRPYSFFLFLSLLSTHLLLAGPGKTALRFILYAAVSALMLYTLYIGLLLLVLHVLIILFFFPRREKPLWLSGAALAGLSFLPWLPVFLGHLSKIRHGWWIPPPNAESVGVSLGAYFLGFSGTNLHYLLAGGMVLLCAAALFFVPAPRKRILAFLLLLGWLSVFAVSVLTPVSIYHERTLLFTLPYVLLCLGLGMEHASLKYLIPVLYLPLVAVSLVHYYSNDYPYRPFRAGIYPRKPVSTIVDIIVPQFQKGDAVFHTATTITFPFLWYAQHQDKNPRLAEFCRSADQRVFIVSRSPSDDFCVNYRDAAVRYPRLWLVQTWWDASLTPDPENERVKELLQHDYHYRVAFEIQVGDILLSLLACDPLSPPEAAAAR